MEESVFKTYLKAQIKNSGRTVNYIQERLDLSRVTYNKKLEDPRLFTVREIETLSTLIEVKKEELFIYICELKE